MRKVHVTEDGTRFVTSSTRRYVLFDAYQRVVKRSDNVSRLYGNATSRDTIVDFGAGDGSSSRIVKAPSTNGQCRSVSSFALVDEKSKLICPAGEVIIDFRGREATFDRISRVPEGGSEGKIICTSIVTGFTHELYPSVFGLVIKEMAR